MKSILSAVNGSCLGPVPAHLDQVVNIVDKLTEVLTNVQMDCDPAMFYNQMRIRFSDGKLVYDLRVEDGGSSKEEWMRSSAAQSLIVQAPDTFLGIEPLTHKPQENMTSNVSRS